MINMLVYVNVAVKPQTPEVRGTAIVKVGDSTTLWCETGSSPLKRARYQFYVNGEKIRGATSQSYRTPRMSRSNDGDKYTCEVILNSVSSDRSRPLEITGICT